MPLLLLIAFPILEIYCLFLAADEFGFLTMLFESFATFWLGMIILRFRGIIFLTMVRERLAKGESPAKEIVESLLIFLGGVFLLFPGLITDTLGLLFLFPYSRKLFVLGAQSFLAKQVKSGRFKVVNMNTQERPQTYKSHTEVPSHEVRDVTPPNKDN